MFAVLDTQGHLLFAQLLYLVLDGFQREPDSIMSECLALAFEMISAGVIVRCLLCVPDPDEAFLAS